MNVGPLTNATTSGLPSQEDPYFTARKLGLRLHMRQRSGWFMRGVDVWFDRQMSLPDQRTMLLGCIERLRAARRAKLRPVRKVNARGRHAAA